MQEGIQRMEAGMGAAVQQAQAAQTIAQQASEHSQNMVTSFQQKQNEMVEHMKLLTEMMAAQTANKRVADQAATGSPAAKAKAGNSQQAS